MGPLLNNRLEMETVMLGAWSEGMRSCACGRRWNTPTTPWSHSKESCGHGHCEMGGVVARWQ